MPDFKDPTATTYPLVNTFNSDVLPQAPSPLDPEASTDQPRYLPLSKTLLAQSKNDAGWVIGEVERAKAGNGNG
jgi:hypothetical protein